MLKILNFYMLSILQHVDFEFMQTLKEALDAAENRAEEEHLSHAATRKVILLCLWISSDIIYHVMHYPIDHLDRYELK